MLTATVRVEPSEAVGRAAAAVRARDQLVLAKYFFKNGRGEDGPAKIASIRRPLQKQAANPSRRCKAKLDPGAASVETARKAHVA